MDKTFIMKLDNEKELLDKASPFKGLETHPVPFPIYRMVFVKPGEVRATIQDHIKNYTDRIFLLNIENYGVDVSINYADGLFKSMILKGDGVQGERIADEIATMLVPKESKNKKNMSLHALLTVQDLEYFKGGIKKHEVPRIVKECLRNGFWRREEREVVCRPYAFYIEGVRVDSYDTWDEIGNMPLSGLNMEYNFDQVLEYCTEHIQEYRYLLPQRGIILEDAEPEDNDSFPPTLFMLEEETVITS